VGLLLADEVTLAEGVMLEVGDCVRLVVPLCVPLGAALWVIVTEAPSVAVCVGVAVALSRPAA